MANATRYDMRAILVRIWLDLRSQRDALGLLADLIDDMDELSEISQTLDNIAASEAQLKRLGRAAA